VDVKSALMVNVFHLLLQNLLYMFLGVTVMRARKNDSYCGGKCSSSLGYAYTSNYSYTVIFIACVLTLIGPSVHITSIVLSILERNPPLLLS